METPEIKVTATNEKLDIRSGELAPPHVLKDITYKGNINAPLSFFSARHTDTLDHIYSTVDFHLTESILLVNHQKRSLTLICGENSQGKVTVEGSLVLSPVLAEVGLNNPNKRRGIAELREFVKYNRGLLHKECDFKALQSELSNVTTKFTKEVIDNNNSTGNEKKSMEIIVEALPKIALVFNLRLFEGMPKTKIEATLEAAVSGGELKFLFYSPDLDKDIEDFADSIIDKVVEGFESKIAIIHQ